MKWRKWNNILHRDLGYFFFGLTVIYAISGLAVNHIQDWNPSYKIEFIESQIEPFSPTDINFDSTAFRILNELGENGFYKSSLFTKHDNFEIFVDGNTISVNPQTGKVLQEKVTSRPFLREFNFLHLNHPKKIWTWVADIYAIGLLLMAITGLFVLRGQKGITGRGAWVTSLGILLPIFFLWLYL
ncbi:MAG: hypothetical protein DWQ06_16890 [Calditrichaeota bacterium]|nr:MAG: hypothetical protein DWQ06_16890 [Calditrichota bacterium]